MDVLHECFRADIEYSANSSKTYLKIPEVQLEDEGLYKCEATYMAVNRECNNVQHIILNVTGALHYIMQHRRINILGLRLNFYQAECEGATERYQSAALPKIQCDRNTIVFGAPYGVRFFKYFIERYREIYGILF